MANIIEKLAAVLEPQAWKAIGLADTLAYQNRRKSSLRKARAILQTLHDNITPEMVDTGTYHFEGCMTPGPFTSHKPEAVIVFQTMIATALKGERA